MKALKCQSCTGNFDELPKDGYIMCPFCGTLHYAGPDAALLSIDLKSVGRPDTAAVYAYLAIKLNADNIWAISMTWSRVASGLGHAAIYTRNIGHLKRQAGMYGSLNLAPPITYNSLLINLNHQDRVIREIAQVVGAQPQDLLVNPPAEVRRQAKEKIAAIEYAAQQLQAEQNSLAHYETKRRRELGDDIRTLEDVARELRSVIFSEAD